MLVVLELDVADLAATRFAISPLSETTRAILLLAKPSPPAVNLPWVRWARAQLGRRPLRLPRTWPLVVNGLPVYPEFLNPTPAVRAPGIESELDRLRATGEEAVRASLRRVFGDHPPDSAIGLLERPRESLAEIAAELAECHDRLVRPHWERIRSVLDADIGYRSALLAAGGARSLFDDLHPDLRWSRGTLTIDDTCMDGLSVFRVALGPDGVVLMPSVFNWPEVSYSKATSTQTALLYPARGTATVWEDGVGAASEPVEELLGATRARLLASLRSPATTSALALRFGVTPSAVSQHLAVLHRGGLVDRQRSGRTVLYQTSELGLALLAGHLLAGRSALEVGGEPVGHL